MAIAPRPPRLAESQFNEVLQNQRMDPTNLTPAQCRVIGNQYMDAIVQIFTSTHRDDEEYLPLKAANLKVSPDRWTFPSDSLLFEIETPSLSRAHYRDGLYFPKEIRIRPEFLHGRFLEWELTEPGTPTYEAHPLHPYVDTIGPHKEFRVYRCYHSELDKFKEFPVKVLYKKWNKDEADDDFFLHCVLLPLGLLGLVSETAE